MARTRPLTPLLTLARDLQRRKGRERRVLFVAEGIRTAEEVLRGGTRIRGALVTPELGESGHGRSLRAALERRAEEVAEVTARELATAAGTETPQGVIVVAEPPDYSLDKLQLADIARMLLLDGVQDPGNAGALLRTAAALGVAATVALPGTVDLWNPKVVRAAMGAHFHTPVLHTGPEEAFAFIDQQGVELWAAESGGEAPEPSTVPRRLALAVGNEGAGLSRAVRSRAAHRVGLPLAAGIESLNVAVAAGILLYELRSREQAP